MELITLLVLIAIFAVLVKDYVSPAIAFLGGLAVLVATNVITTEQAFAGFSNDTLITIASLFVMARSIEKTIDVEKLTNKLFGSSGNIKKSLARMVVPVGVSSAFVNNTPIVAMLINPVTLWAKKHKLPSSKFLIPLSYATILGGTLTLIGTSTNLVVSGLLSQNGLPAFSFFELTRYSLPVVVLGMVTIVLLSKWLIPERRLADLSANDIEKQFTVEMSPNENLVGKTVSSAKLRNLRDVFLAEIIRANGDTLAPIAPHTVIKQGDILRFSGNAESLAKLTEHEDLTPNETKKPHQDFKDRTFVEVVIGHNKSIVGKTLVSVGFRARYQASVLAIFRAGEKLKGSLGNISLKPGDSLLIVSDSGFVERWNNHSDFLYLRQLSKSASDKKTSQLLLVSLGLLFVLLALGAPLPIAAMAGALASVVLGVNTLNQARNAIDFDLLIMIGAAIGVAKAVEVSGLAQSVSSTIVGSFDGLGQIGLLFGIILATVVLTELVTNAAAALMIFPIALTIANQAQIDPRAFAVAIAITASLSFISPLGYQTNTMVYSAGGYKFKDFFKLGSVLTIITVIGLTTVISFSFGLTF